MKTMPLDPATINNTIKQSSKQGKKSQVSQLENTSVQINDGVSFVPTKRPVVTS